MNLTLSKARLIQGAVALTIAIWLWNLFKPDEKSAIKQMFKELGEQSSFEGTRPPLAALSEASEVASSFDDDCRILWRAPEQIKPVVSGRKELIQKLATGRSQISQLTVHFELITIEVQGDKARVSLIAKAMGRTPGHDDSFLEQHEVDLKLVKQSGSWKISEAINRNPIDPEDSH